MISSIVFKFVLVQVICCKSIHKECIPFLVAIDDTVEPTDGYIRWLFRAAQMCVYVEVDIGSYAIVGVCPFVPQIRKDLCFIRFNCEPVRLPEPSTRVCTQSNGQQWGGHIC